jgi:hypothetical protein
MKMQYALLKKQEKVQVVNAHLGLRMAFLRRCWDQPSVVVD